MSDKYEFIAAECATFGEFGDAPTMVQMCSVDRRVEIRFLRVAATAGPAPPLGAASCSRTRSGRCSRRSAAPTGTAASTPNSSAPASRSAPSWSVELMRELGLVPVQPRPFRITTCPTGRAETVDLLRRDFSADRPGIKVVGDITYIRTWQGWLYLATLIDCFNREVIGWSMADHLRTELVTDALDMAVRNHRLEPDSIMHSDRGTQYTSAEYRATLTRLGLRHSVGRTGQCWDNALAESFFASLKNERVHHIVYPTRKKAKDDIARYIELFYNQRRIHSALGYRTPREVRTEYLNSQLAA